MADEKKRFQIELKKVKLLQKENDLLKSGTGESSLFDMTGIIASLTAKLQEVRYVYICMYVNLILHKP